MIAFVDCTSDDARYAKKESSNHKPYFNLKAESPTNAANFKNIRLPEKGVFKIVASLYFMWAMRTARPGWLPQPTGNNYIYTMFKMPQIRKFNLRICG